MYIKEAFCISPQKTFSSEFTEGHFHEHQGTRYFALEPSYEGIISAGALRRMGKAVRMGVAAGSLLLKNNPPVDGIIIGTANGGLEDCIKFLNQIVDYEEGTLTPTNFVQSTPNAIAGQLAMAYRNTGYNITHTHGGLSFENALIDASLLFDEGQADTLLVGALEEISEYNFNIDRLSGYFKAEETSSANLINSGTKGTVSGEGAIMFLVGNQTTGTEAVRIQKVTTLSHAAMPEVKEKLHQLLAGIGSTVEQVDALILGYNGNVGENQAYDDFRSEFADTTSLLSFKNACGEYPTASSFAVWLGMQLIQGKNIPDALWISPRTEKKVKNVVIYNQYDGFQHSLILLDQPD